MPLLIALGLAFGAILLAILLMPISLLQRYRVGTSRRQARGWIITLNFAAVTFSACVFLVSAAVTNIWIPDAFRYAMGGLAAGSLLGIVGLLLTRWEYSPRGLYYTPNRWLVLAITLLVSARIAYGFWRSWQAWRLAAGDTSWIVSSGVAGSLAAGAVVLGYYLIYWFGVRRRNNRAYPRYPR